jgi:two-component system, sensor histidine kinase and response regulator
MTTPSRFSPVDQPQGQVTPLDALALARLREIDPTGRADVVGRVLRTFETSVVKFVSAFESAADQHDWAQLQYLSHTMKSSSASVGAMALSDWCKTIEMTLRGGAHALPPDTAAALHQHCNNALAATRRALGG